MAQIVSEDNSTPENRKGAIVSSKGEHSANEKQNYIYCHVLTLPEPSGKKRMENKFRFYILRIQSRVERATLKTHQNILGHALVSH